MRQQSPRYRKDQTAFLITMETNVLEAAEAGHEPKLILDTSILRRLLEIAKRASRSQTGHPSNSLQPKHLREKTVELARDEWAKLKVDAKKHGG
jgi:hypothetical protein